ncbi:MAG: alpha/beta hydrolase [Acidobacteriota bacterium]
MVHPTAVGPAGDDAVSLRNYFLAGPAGRIECLLKKPGEGAPPRAAAVVCHPHPLFGGTMHNKTVHAVTGAMLAAGLPVLRFNFRGAGLSDGEHDSGVAELEDLGVVIDHLAGLYPSSLLVVAGYSFGAFVGLKGGCRNRRVAALIGIGVPVSLYDFTFLAGCDKPVAMIQGERDPFGHPFSLAKLAARTRAGITILPIDGAGHDLAGHREALRQRVVEALRATIDTLSV